MKRVVFDGVRVASILSGVAELININTPEGSVFLDTDDGVAVAVGDYLDNGVFCTVPDSPTKYHVFDYNTKQWIDPRSLDEIKAQKWTEIKSERDRLEFGGFEFEGNIYDSDQVSQGRILGAASAGLDQVWTLADNTTVNLTADQLVQLYQALQVHIAAAHERGRVARQAIMSAITKEDVEAVTL